MNFVSLSMYRHICICCLAFFCVGGMLAVALQLPSSVAYAVLPLPFLYVVVVLMRRHDRWWRSWLLFYLPMFILIGYSLMVSPFDKSKVLSFLFLFVILPILGRTLLADVKSLTKFFHCLAIFGVLIAVLTILNPNAIGNAGRLVVSNSNPIWLSRSLGFSCLWFLILFINKKMNLFFFSVLGCLVTTVMLLTGSRGPLLSLAGSGLIISIVLFQRLRKSKIFLLIMGLSPFVVAAAVYIFLRLVPEVIVMRFLGGLSADIYSGSGTVDLLRTKLISLSWEWIQQNPYGIGIGQFHNYVFPYYTYIYYPHNLILEFLLEIGWVFGIYFSITFLIAIIVMLRHARKHIAYQGLLGLLVMAFMNSLFSGDMTSPKELYLLLPIPLYLLFSSVSSAPLVVDDKMRERT